MFQKLAIYYPQALPYKGSFLEHSVDCMSDISQTKLHILMMKTTHQLEDLDDAWRCLEIPYVESDLQRLGVGAGVGHHRDIGLGGGLGGQVHRPIVIVHHPAEILCTRSNVCC